MKKQIPKACAGATAILLTLMVSCGYPPVLRACVAEKLIESLDAPDAPALSVKWKKEVRRRCAELDRGTVELHDADAVFARAYAALA